MRKSSLPLAASFYIDYHNFFEEILGEILTDILIIGGGIIGLSLAIELKLRGAQVTILSSESHQAAATAAAGMLAPQAENIPPSPMLDLCLQSRALYPEWIGKLETITGLTTGYWPCGILSPVYEQPEVTYNKQLTLNSQWLDKDAIHQHQPGLSNEIIGGWWYPNDAQVDNRALFQTLQIAAKKLKIDISQERVEEIIRSGTKVLGVKTSSGELQANHYILATGAWSNQLLPVPVYPKKGQMLSVCPPPETPPIIQQLQMVLFGDESYIVPRKDGQIIIGATSENVNFTPGNTPWGIQALLSRAIRLYPELQHYLIQEFWWGFRPATPDELPILGYSAWDNLTLATGHYRNGILLAPVTAIMIADWIEQHKSDPLLSHFHYSRFADSGAPHH
ncbi:MULTISPECIES: glycine oxidase ThiO [Kamptonema]|uniref:glycine oxidase ThiO n=1 Tax=Kamptonema TaxID=1501433 RepID=UPI001F3E549B|nr:MULTISPECIES: glycine oxidase ThiO [Kamptonema]